MFPSFVEKLNKENTHKVQSRFDVARLDLTISNWARSTVVCFHFLFLPARLAIVDLYSALGVNITDRPLSAGISHGRPPPGYSFQLLGNTYIQYTYAPGFERGRFMHDLRVYTSVIVGNPLPGVFRPFVRPSVRFPAASVPGGVRQFGRLQFQLLLSFTEVGIRGSFLEPAGSLS